MVKLKTCGGRMSIALEKVFEDQRQEENRVFLTFFGAIY
jgi:hypothetical protein